MRLFVLTLAVAGCLQAPGLPPSPALPPPPLESPPPGPPSAGSCGDGICWAGETCTSCELDCGACPPVCPVAGDLGSQLPIDRDVTLNDAATTTSCGQTTGGVSWTAPAAGVYHIASTAPVTSVQLGDCNGPQLVCGNRDVPMQAGEHVLVSLGGAPTAELTITRVPDACGDNVCEASEACDSCAADCGACPYCGDGVCDAGEDTTSCPQDCEDTSGGGGGGGGGPTCGDGFCDALESCDSCSFDCGSCPIDSCGDGICGASETSVTCPIDCD